MKDEIKLKIKDPKYRLTTKTFQFPKAIKDYFYTANYFVKTKQIVEKYLPGMEITMQFFQRRDHVMVCGIDESIALLSEFAINPEQLIVEALHDGMMINNKEPVLKVTGIYEHFGFLESLIDGILGRRTNTATNTYEIIQAVGKKDVFSMADRQDDYLTQAGDGYASYIAGMRKYSTDAQGSLVGIKGMGTMPHALIAMCDGDVVKASQLFNKTFPEMKVTALVDYQNDCVNDSIKVAKALGSKLGAIRLDTSLSLTDEYFKDKDVDQKAVAGVSKELVFAVRNGLDKAGFKDVKIVVSSSFNPEKIQMFEKNNVPVDLYGVGSYIVNNRIIGFTGDIVRVNDKPQAKVGRQEYANPRLERVFLPKRV